MESTKFYGMFNTIRMFPDECRRIRLIYYGACQTMHSAEVFRFKVCEEEFNQIVGRIEAENITYGSEPYDAEKKKINNNYDGKDVCFRDEMECLLETLSVGYEITY